MVTSGINTKKWNIAPISGSITNGVYAVAATRWFLPVASVIGFLIIGVLVTFAAWPAGPPAETVLIGDNTIVAATGADLRQGITLQAPCAQGSPENPFLAIRPFTVKALSGCPATVSTPGATPEVPVSPSVATARLTLDAGNTNGWIDRYFGDIALVGQHVAGTATVGASQRTLTVNVTAPPTLPVFAILAGLALSYFMTRWLIRGRQAVDLKEQANQKKIEIAGMRSDVNGDNRPEYSLGGYADTMLGAGLDPPPPGSVIALAGAGDTTAAEKRLQEVTQTESAFSEFLQRVEELYDLSRRAPPWEVEADHKAETPGGEPWPAEKLWPQLKIATDVKELVAPGGPLPRELPDEAKSMKRAAGIDLDLYNRFVDDWRNWHRLRYLIHEARCWCKDNPDCPPDMCQSALGSLQDAGDVLHDAFTELANRRLKMADIRHAERDLDKAEELIYRARGEFPYEATQWRAPRIVPVLTPEPTAAPAPLAPLPKERATGGAGLVTSETGEQGEARKRIERLQAYKRLVDLGILLVSMLAAAVSAVALLYVGKAFGTAFDLLLAFFWGIGVDQGLRGIGAVLGKLNVPLLSGGVAAQASSA